MSKTRILGFFQEWISLNSDFLSLITNCYCYYYNLGSCIYNLFCLFWWSWCIQLLVYDYFNFFHYWSYPSLVCIHVLITINFYFLLHASLKITSERPTNQCSFEENSCILTKRINLCTPISIFPPLF